MKARSLWQPFVSLVAEGVKTIETRSTAPGEKMIGQRIAIHAANRKITRPEYDLYQNVDQDIYLALTAMYGRDWKNAMPYGAVVATATLAAAGKVWGRKDDYFWLRDADERWLTSHEVPPSQLPYGDFSDGRWLWFLEDIEKLPEPIPATGRQGWWEWGQP